MKICPNCQKRYRDFDQYCFVCNYKLKYIEGTEKIEYCPSCNSKLVDIGPNLFCLNTYNCPEQIKERIIHYASRDAMNIDGISDKTIDLFYEKLNLRSVADLYDLTYDDLFNLEGFKNKKTENMLKAIENSKNVSLAKFIYAIGILNVGKKTALDLSKKFKNLNNIINASMEDLINIKNVGEIVANSIIDYFKNEKNIDLINLILQKGVKIIDSEEVEIKDNFFKDKKVVLTGSLINYKRDKLSEILQNLGAEVVSSVSKNTDLVIVGSDAGSKLDKATKLGIKIMNEEELIKTLDNCLE